MSRIVERLKFCLSKNSQDSLDTTFVQPQLKYCAALFALASLDVSSVTPKIIAYHSLRKRLENFGYTSTSNRHNGIPRTKNGRDRILDARYDAETQRQLIYWRKGMFAIGRKCICGESFTLSHAERCFGTHMKLEEMIAAGEYSNVTYYVDAMWTAMKNP